MDWFLVGYGVLIAVGLLAGSACPARWGDFLKADKWGWRK